MKRVHGRVTMIQQVAGVSQADKRFRVLIDGYECFHIQDLRRPYGQE
jgi:hypothetical protein